MNLKKILSDDEILTLVRLNETGSGQVLLKVLEYEKNRVRLDLEHNPIVANDKTDFRFKAGVIEGIKLAEQASSDARLIVIKTEERKES
jgi:hypothetical protein